MLPLLVRAAAASARLATSALTLVLVVATLLQLAFLVWTAGSVARSFWRGHRR
jgi:hypothetical protein